MIQFSQLQSGELVKIGRIENGEIVDDTNGLVEEYTRAYDLSDEETIIDAFDGPVVFAATDTDLSDGRRLEGTPEWDEHYLELFDRVWNADGDKQLFQFNPSETPEFVKERLKEAIRGGAVFSEFDHIPSDELMQLRQYLIEELDDGSWTIDGIANRLQDLDGEMTFDQAQTVARTELASTVNTARAEGYEQRGEEDAKFKWVGNLDDRTTETCTWLLEQTNPKHGGEPVSLEKLRELIEEAPEHDPEMQDNMARPENYLPHINCRKTYVKSVSD